jgi:hypothetical protein
VSSSLGERGSSSATAPFRVALSQLRFREQQRAGAVLGRYFVGAPEVFERQIEASGSQRQLARPQEAARGQIGVAKLFGQFAQSRVPVRILGIEKRDAFAAGQGFDVAPCWWKMSTAAPNCSIASEMRFCFCSSVA